MHAARNRRASRQHVPKTHQPPPAARSARQEQEFMLRSAGTPPAFPRDLILPGSQQASSAPAITAPPESRANEPLASSPAHSCPVGPQTARRPKGKKARKAAMRMAAEQARKAAPPKAAPVILAPPPVILAPAHASPPPACAITSPAPQPAGEEVQPVPCAVAAIENCASAPTLITPAPLPDLVPVPAPDSAPQPRVQPAPALQPAPAIVLPSVPEPLVTASPPIAADSPLPRSRSLVPARRQGLVDVIAFLLRDSGRRLARWSARRHKMREQYAQVYAADLRKAALQSQLEALEALRQQQPR